jgi:hypothetical protein
MSIPAAIVSRCFSFVDMSLLYTFVACLHSDDDAVVRVHDTFSQRQNIIEHIHGAFWRNKNKRSLLQHLHYNWQIGFESTSDSLSYIAEALKNGWLVLLVQVIAL